MQLETERTTAYILEQWGIWSRERLNIGYSKISPMWIGKLKPAVHIQPDILDSEAVDVDRLLAKLESKDPIMGQVTIHFYKHGCCTSYTAGQLNINRRRVDVLVGSGTAWIDAALYISRAA